MAPESGLARQFGLFADREIAYEPVELTSRVDTSKVSEAKAKLGLPFYGEEPCGRCDCHQHDFGWARHYPTGLDGRVRSAEDFRRVHTGKQSRWTRS